MGRLSPRFMDAEAVAQLTAYLLHKKASRGEMLEAADAAEMIARWVHEKGVSILGNSAKAATTFVISQIFSYILTRTKPQSWRTERHSSRIGALITKVDARSEFAFLFNALQVFDDLDTIEAAFKISCESKHEEADLTSLAFDALPRKKQQDWLHYFLCSRRRLGNGICHHVIAKHCDPALQRLALKALAAIGSPCAEHKSERIKMLVLHSDDPEIQITGVRALWETHQDPRDTSLKDFFVQEFMDPHTSGPYQRALIGALGNYAVHSQKDRPWIDRLIALSEGTDEELTCCAAQTLARLGDEAALKRAYTLVKSPLWDRFEQESGAEFAHHDGQWWRFLIRPVWENNRALVLSRIESQLSALWKPETQNVENSPALQEFKHAIRTITPRNTRFVGTPIYYPKEGGAIYRGLGRKGMAIPAILDVIENGMHGSDLGEHDDYEQSSWAKIGHMFATHSSDTALAYGRDSDGALAIIDSNFANEETQKGYTRHEYEGTCNIVFYRGIPKHAIVRIFVSEPFHNDINLLAGDTPTPRSRSTALFPLFKNLSRLKQLRGQLQQVVRHPITNAEEPYYKRFQTFDYHNNAG